ncbi:RES family NAD+ phosphorylase [Paracidovorax cattleyae]|uniref:RES family NAD+ phosphorylase n=1 Tax=Paracidovorax cattleyae TaxID=80868 RepID=UPI0018AF8295|nr:RES family NAD+ phosphorylase [Paracidovorax cattleyae]MBF9264072.1 RES family NAD+ phosphorylase [Paracidovorax cattleyae]
MSQPRPVLDPGFDLATERLTRTTLHRVYWSGQNPLAASIGRKNRYDCPPRLAAAKQFGVLYLAYDLPTCWMETIVRTNMVRAAGTDIQIPLTSMTHRWACEVTATGSLVLAHFADEPLIDLGDCASNIMGDSYLRTRRWSQLLHAHKNPAVDGIRYRSRFNSGQFCIALFDRAVAPRGLAVANPRSIDPATSREAQSVMRRFKVVPI